MDISGFGGVALENHEIEFYEYSLFLSISKILIQF